MYVNGKEGEADELLFVPLRSKMEPTFGGQSSKYAQYVVTDTLAGRAGALLPSQFRGSWPGNISSLEVRTWLHPPHRTGGTLIE